MTILNKFGTSNKSLLVACILIIFTVSFTLPLLWKQSTIVNSMNTIYQKFTLRRLLFLGIVLIGIFLFSYKITTAPFMNDELDVLNRAGLNSLKEVF